MRNTSVFSIVLLAVLFAGCSGGNGPGGPPPPPALTVSCAPAQVQVGQTSQCLVSPKTSGTWSVAVGPGTVSSSGLYTASQTGSATVRFTATDGRTGQFTITVTASPSPGDILFTRIFTGCGNGCTDVFAMNADGSNVHPLTTDTRQDGEPSWSPDKARVAFTSNRDGKIRVYSMNSDGSNQVVVSPASYQFANNPSWSPGGTKLVFVWSSDTEAGIAAMNADGSGAVELTRDHTPQNLPGHPRVSPDGTRILYTSSKTGVAQIWVMGADGSSPHILSPSSSVDGDASWSPDGERIAFASNRLDNLNRNVFNVWLMNADGSSPSQLTSAPSGFADAEPTWSPDGAQIAFTRNDGTSYDIYVVSASVGTPQKRTSSGLNFNPDWR